MNDMPTTTIRASSLSDLFDCAARWESKHLRGMRMPSSSNSTLGRAVHAGTAAYDASRIDGNPITVDDAASAVVDTIHKPDEDVDWGDDKPQEAERIAIDLHRLYCKEVAPKQNYVAVEAACDRLDITDIGISLTGTVDRVCATADGYGIADIKTGARAVGADGTVTTAGHAAQIAVYELLASHATGRVIDAPAQIVGLQVAKTAKGQRCGIGTITGARDLLLGDDEFPGLLQHAAAIIKSGMFPGNPRSMMCHEKYCPAFARCKWRM